MIVTASGGACRGMNGYVPVPTEWPEQQVHSRHGRGFAGGQDPLRDGGRRREDHERQDRAAGRRPGGEGDGDFEVRRSAILPPENTDGYVLPDPKKLPPRFAPILRRARRSRAAIRRSAIWPRRSASTRKRRGTRRGDLRLGPREGQVPERPAEGRLGGPEGRHGRLRGDQPRCSSPFAGRPTFPPARSGCPATAIPSSIWWTTRGKGIGFRASRPGAGSSAESPRLRPILQKGDNFRPPRNGGKERQRYLAESLTVGHARRRQAAVKFIRETAAK